MLLRFLGAALLCGWLLGCSPTESEPFVPDAGEPTYSLEVLSTGSLGLAFGESRDFWVMARDEAGMPLRNLEVTFLLDGAFQDSGLATVRASTGSNGIAKTRILAGYANAVFRIRAIAPYAPPVSRYVSVSVGGFGVLSVTARYRGERPLGGFALGVYFEATCGDRRVLDGDPPDREASLAQGVYEASFDQLPASSTYAVHLEALAPSGTVIGRGCVDGITLMKNETKAFMLDADDLPGDAEGEYASTLTLALGGYPATLAEAGEDGGEAVIDAAGSEAGFLLDALGAWLDDAGQGEASGALASARAASSLEADLEGALDAAEEGPSAALTRARDAVQGSVALRIEGKLTIAARAASGSRLAFATGALSLGPSETELHAVDLASAAVDLGWSSSETFDEIDASIPEMTCELGLSSAELARAALDAASGAAGATSTPAWLAEVGGCATLAESEELSAVVGEACDGACVEAACEAAMGSIVDAMDASWSAGPGYDGLKLSGALALTDADEDLVMDGFVGDLTYALVGPSDASLAVDGTFEGARLATP
jgi:hypothetical protein